jgi:outer membrane protein
MFILMAFTAMVAGQTAKLAYVDSEIILRDLPEAQKAQKELEAMVTTWQEELEKMSAELQKGVEEYQKKQALMLPAAKESEEKRLTDLQQKAREYQAQRFDPRTGDVVTEREKKLTPIRERILKAIEAVAKDEGFGFVFDKANDVLLLYADVKYDLTYRVLDKLKRGLTGKTK